MATSAPAASAAASGRDRKGRRGHQNAAARRKMRSGDDGEVEEKIIEESENLEVPKLSSESTEKVLTPRSLFKLMSLPSPLRTRSATATAAPPTTTATATISSASASDCLPERQQTKAAAPFLPFGPEPWALAAATAPGTIPVPASSASAVVTGASFTGTSGAGSSREQLRARGLQTLQRSWGALHHQGAGPAVAALGAPGAGGAAPVPTMGTMGAMGLALAPKMPPPPLPAPTALSLGGVNHAGNGACVEAFPSPYPPHQGMVQGYPMQQAGHPGPNIWGSHSGPTPQPQPQQYMQQQPGMYFGGPGAATWPPSPLEMPITPGSMPPSPWGTAGSTPMGMPSPVGSECFTPMQQQCSPQPDLMATLMPDPFFMNQNQEQIANHLRSMAPEVYED